MRKGTSSKWITTGIAEGGGICEQSRSNLSANSKKRIKFGNGVRHYHLLKVSAKCSLLSRV